MDKCFFETNYLQGTFPTYVCFICFALLVILEHGKGLDALPVPGVIAIPLWSNNSYTVLLCPCYHMNRWRSWCKVAVFWESTKGITGANTARLKLDKQTMFQPKERYSKLGAGLLILQGCTKLWSVLWKSFMFEGNSIKGAFFGLIMDEKKLKKMTTQLVEKGGAFTWVSYF